MPAGRRRAVEAVEDVRQVVLVDPGPVVAHGDLAVARRRPRPCRPGGLHLAALSSRFADRALERRGHAVRSCDSCSSVSNATRGRLRRARSTALRDEQVEAHVLGLACRRCRRARARPARRRASVISPSCSTTSREQLLALVRRQRVGRARAPRCSSAGSSAASAARATRRRRAAAARAATSSSAASIVLKLAASRAQLVAARSRRCAARGRASRVTCSVASRQPPHRLERRARDERGRARGDADARQPRSGTGRA